MKKLIVALMAVATAFVVNAAAIDWSVDYSYQPGADTDSGPFAEGWIMAVFDAGVTETATANAITSLLTDGAASAVSTYAVSTAIANSDGGATGMGVTMVGEKGGSASAFLVLFDSATVEGAENFYVSAMQTVNIASTGLADTMYFGEAGDLLGSAVAANWTALGGGEAVPEPTSGLLLLVGGALLALKRRRA